MAVAAVTVRRDRRAAVALPLAMPVLAVVSILLLWRFEA